MLLVAPQTSTSVAATLYPKLPYDVVRDLAIITVLGSRNRASTASAIRPPKLLRTSNRK